MEFICDRCGKRREHPPERYKENPQGTHICRDCIREWIREYAKKIMDAPLTYASYDSLIEVYYGMQAAWGAVQDVRSPFVRPCPVCGEPMKMHDPVRGIEYCPKCQALYDRYGQLLGNVLEKEDLDGLWQEASGPMSGKVWVGPDTEKKKEESE